jgi:hypothetical protein
MNEKELGDALLRFTPAGPTLGNPGDPAFLLGRVLDRDRRRVRMLTGATILLWIVAAAGIPLFFVLYVTFIQPKAVDVLQEIITHRRGYPVPELANTANQVLFITLKLGIVLVTGSVFTLLLAACATVMLVFAARRATLRQVNANLAEISEQLRRAQPPRG